MNNVNHPAHYETGNYECIDVMVEAMGVDAVMDFCLCNAFKYLYRQRRKNGKEDVRKAMWYLSKWLDLESAEWLNKNESLCARYEDYCQNDVMATEEMLKHTNEDDINKRLHECGTLISEGLDGGINQQGCLLKNVEKYLSKEEK